MKRVVFLALVTQVLFWGAIFQLFGGVYGLLAIHSMLYSPVFMLARLMMPQIVAAHFIHYIYPTTSALVAMIYIFFLSNLALAIFGIVFTSSERLRRALATN